MLSALLAASLSDKIAAAAFIVGFLQFVALMLTVGVMRRTAQRQLRAYVLPEGGKLLDGTMVVPPMPAHANEPAVNLIFKNSGLTPAFDFVSIGEIVITPPQNIRHLKIARPKRMFPATVGASAPQPKSLRLWRQMTAQEIADVTSGQQFIVAQGRVEYRDAFRRKRWTTFRLQYAGQWPPRQDALLNFSETGNNAN